MAWIVIKNKLCTVDQLPEIGQEVLAYGQEQLYNGGKPEDNDEWIIRHCKYELEDGVPIWTYIIQSDYFKSLCNVKYWMPLPRLDVKDIEKDQKILEDIQKEDFDPKEYYKNKNCYKCNKFLKEPIMDFGFHYWCKDCYQKGQIWMEEAGDKAFDEFMKS
jgi:hypothetical protein